MRVANYEDENPWSSARNTDEIESDARRLADHKRENPDTQVSTIEELDAIYASGEKSGYFEFARKLDNIYDFLAQQGETNKRMLEALHNIESAVGSIKSVDHVLEQQLNQTHGQQDGSGNAEP